MYVKPVLKTYSTQALQKIVANAATMCKVSNFNCPGKENTCYTWDANDCVLYTGNR